jgi:hypothetical protein
MPDIKQLLSSLVEVIGDSRFPSVPLIAAVVGLDLSNARTFTTPRGGVGIRHGTLDEGIVDVSVAAGLLPRRAYPEFQELASNPGEYIDACVRLISSPKLPDEERRIAGFAMHHLEVADYVVFIRKLLAEYRAGKVTTSDLIGTAFQVSPFFDVPIEHFDDPSVQRLLYYIVAIPGISPSDKDFIFSILSGQRWLDQREGCWEGNCMTDPPPPRLKEHAPSEFAFFTRKFSLDDFRNVPDRLAWISAIVRTNRADENAVIEKFLDTLLIPPSDRFTDYDLEYLWRIYNRSFVVSKPGELRAFLTQIHDAIARQAPHP